MARYLIGLFFWINTSLGGTVALCPAALAQDEPLVENNAEPWQIKADRIEYDQAQDEYVATGQVSIVRQERTLTADKVRLNQKTGEALADGHVRLLSDSDILSGSRLELNLNDETGVLTDGNVFISKNHLYLSGRKIRKTGLQSYAAEQISITSCPGPDPDWEITGKDFKVTIEGYGSAKHTALWAGKIPVLYSPYLFFPVKLKRQSGLLMPEFGYSDRKGSQYLQPVYWAIDESSDATFYSHFMSERGLRNGIEYRYVLDEDSKGAAFAEGFQDRKIDDGQGDNSRRWGYEDDGALRENQDRYWFRMKHDQNFGGDWTAKLDLDVVSDQDYLHEFKSGYDGFDETRAYFQDTFGRDLDDYNDPIRVNRLNVNRTWTQYSFNGDLRWNDNVIKRRQGSGRRSLWTAPVKPLAIRHCITDWPPATPISTASTAPGVSGPTSIPGSTIPSICFRPCPSSRPWVCVRPPGISTNMRANPTTDAMTFTAPSMISNWIPVRNFIVSTISAWPEPIVSNMPSYRKSCTSIRPTRISPTTRNSTPSTASSPKI